MTESGYAGFLLPVELYFKNKEEPKKIRFEYDLFLQGLGGPAVNNSRCEKLTFQNPTEEFKEKLFKAGAVSIIKGKAKQRKKNSKKRAFVFSYLLCSLFKAKILFYG